MRPKASAPMCLMIWLDVVFSGRNRVVKTAGLSSRTISLWNAYGNSTGTGGQGVYLQTCFIAMRGSPWRWRHPYGICSGGLDRALPYGAIPAQYGSQAFSYRGGMATGYLLGRSAPIEN